MGYKNTRELLAGLESRGELVRVREEVDPNLVAPAVQRRVSAAGGPAVYFENCAGTPFPMACNLFGTMDRVRYIFRDTLKTLDLFFKLKLDPMQAVKSPLRYARTIPALAHSLPKKVKTGPVMDAVTSLSSLPNLRSWPMDGGAFVTLPQVYTESPEKPGFAKSNMGMYRVQLNGNEFEPDAEAGLHYQIHRGIGPHHAQALARGESLPVNVFVGGPPAMTLAAVMPLPEGIPEILFAGVLGGSRVSMVAGKTPLPLLAEADFCIRGRVEPGKVKPEGPFGDHLGYYSLAHDFPVLTVEAVHHRKDAVWPFTSVGRPPQEDSVLGAFIHELTSELVPEVFAGVREVHAVDAAGVHPLLLALGSERYVPFAEERAPQELLTQAMGLLGHTQTSLSKYVLIAASEDDKSLSAHHIPDFFDHLLRRFDPARDLHFITRTTMDTLDYSGISLNQGSKLIWACAGEPRRELAARLPGGLNLPGDFGGARVFAPGMVVLAGPPHALGRDEHDPAFFELAEALEKTPGLDGLPLFVVVDDAVFTAANWDNFLWVTFTRSDPATDIYGAGAFTRCKHWGATGPLVVDARLKTFHAPPLVEDPDAEKQVDALAASGGPLHGVL